MKYKQECQNNATPTAKEILIIRSHFDTLTVIRISHTKKVEMVWAIEVDTLNLYTTR